MSQQVGSDSPGGRPLTRLSKLMNASRPFVAIDYSDGYVRLLEFSADRAGAMRIVKQVCKPMRETLETGDPESLGRTLAALLSESGIGSRQAIFAISRDTAVLHYLTVPATRDDDLANLVRFRISQELPFATEEAAVDYVVTDRDDAGLATAVLAGAVKLEHLDHLRHVARVAGLKVVRVGLRPYSNYLACRHAGLLDQDATLFIELGHDAAEIGAFSVKGSLFSRSVTMTGASDTADRLTEQTLLQLQRTLPAYRMSGRGQEFTRILVAGETGSEESFVVRVSEQLKLPATRFDVGTTMSACYGMAAGQLMSASEQFDFHMPKRAVDWAARRTRMIQLSVAAGIAVIIVAVALTNQMVSSRKATLSKINSANADLKKQVDKLNDFREQVDAITAWQAGDVNWLNELKILGGLMPDPSEAYIASIMLGQPANKGVLQLDLDVRAKDGLTVNALYDRLLASKHYEEVGRSNLTDNPGATSYRQTLKMTLKVKMGASPTTRPATVTAPAGAEPVNVPTAVAAPVVPVQNPAVAPVLPAAKPVAGKPSVKSDSGTFSPPPAPTSGDRSLESSRETPVSATPGNVNGATSAKPPVPGVGAPPSTARRAMEQGARSMPRGTGAASRPGHFRPNPRTRRTGSAAGESTSSEQGVTHGNE